MHISRHSILALLIATAFAASPAAAQGRGAAPKTHPVKTTAGGATHTSGPKPSSGPKTSPAPKAHGGNAAKAPKTTTTASNTKAPKAPKSAKTTTATPTTTTTTTTPTVTLTPVQQKLQKNTNLASKLESRLPKGTDLMLAADGFRNLGQFVAAVNVSNNLDIPFTALKTSMVDDGLSLGQSIQKLRPLADATHEASLAESQATKLVNSTTTTTTTSTSTKAKKRTGSSQE